ncbi:MAG: cysteine synthase A [Candidatus Latescibacteria bacterium]|nr:cysteine synthase A [Candidatus Latescibacterota bacterium]
MPKPNAVVDSILDLIGDTPLVRLNRIAGPGVAEVCCKVEFFNPGRSVKDRIGREMIETAEQDGRLGPGRTIVEPTSGNTGIGLALAAATKGYRLILTMPETMSLERRQILASYGAEVVLTPGREDMPGAVQKAREIAAQDPACFVPQQFDNPANAAAHRRTTAREILEATEGWVDAFVAGVGTGGTITGVGEVLKAHDPNVLIVAVEPAASPVLSGGRPGLHNIQGIGAGFVPSILNRDVIDEVVTVEEEEAFRMVRRLSREEGLLVGVSAGANVAVALRVAERLGPGKRVVTILCDSGERYFSLEAYLKE